MDYASMYMAIFQNLTQVFIALLPFFLIVIIINVIKNNCKKKKKTNNNAVGNIYKLDTSSKLDYEQSDYFKETNTSYEDMITDKGKVGEYAAYRNIRNISGYKKFLFNVYIENKNNADRKAEIDVIMIHETGIYVIESKNFRGWIFGDETSDKWCQSFKNGKKFYFYNPIKQNYKHIQYLRGIVGEDKEIVSIITFGDDATLKKIVNTNQNLKVINNRILRETIESKIRNSETKMTQEQIDEIYNSLKSKQW